MNLFVVTKGEISTTPRELLSALSTDAMYSSLAAGYESQSWQSNCSTTAFAAVYEGACRARPRQYVHDADDALVAYDGLPIDAQRRFSAHEASCIAANWDRFDDEIDGFYGAVRISKADCSIQAQVDIFGVYKLYTWTDGKSVVISNSVAAIDFLVKNIQYDHDAIGMFLCMAWVPGKHTLLKDVHCLGPAERQTWVGDRLSPDTSRTITSQELFRYPPKNPSNDLVRELAKKLIRSCKELGGNFPNVLIPLTGGKDSRLLAVLLSKAGVAARAYTYGNVLGADAQIAAQVADVLGIEHESILTGSEELLSQWDEFADDFVRKGDGLCPLQLITGQITAAEVDEQAKPIRLWGAGSSICRAPYFYPLAYLRKMDVSNVKKLIRLFTIKDYKGLIRPEATAIANSYVSSALDQYSEEGIRPADLPDLFWAHERGSARSGKNMRTSMNRRDTYSPFFGKAFATASFSMSPLQRATEPLHYRLMERLAPELLELPFDKGQWKPQNKYLHLADEVFGALRVRGGQFISKRRPGKQPIRPKHMLAKDTMFERVAWLRQISAGMREQLNDASCADMQRIIEIKKFNRITDPDATDELLAQHIVPLFTISTVLMYRQAREGGVARHVG